MWINLDDGELEIVKQALSRKASFHLVSSQIEETKAVHALQDKIKDLLTPDPTDAAYIEQARTTTNDELEIDDETTLSRADEGRWVMAWIWVSNEEAGACSECGAIPGTPDYGTVGDGYDGLCPSCADKADPEAE